MPADIAMYDAPVRIIKQASGVYRWYGASSVNALDRDGEIISETAMQLDVYRTKTWGDDSALYLFHFTGEKARIGGAPDYRAIVSGHLIETGEFDDNIVGRGVAKLIQTYPAAPDGKGWGLSVGFEGLPDDKGVYDQIHIRERSVLPLSAAANPFTSFGVKGISKMLTAKQIEFLEQVKATSASDPEIAEAMKLILAATDQSKMLNAAGIQRKQAAEQVGTNPIQINSAGNYSVVPADGVPATAQAWLGFPRTKAEGDVAAVAQASANLDIAAQAVAQAQAAVAEVTTIAAPVDEVVAEDVVVDGVPVDEVKADEPPPEGETEEVATGSLSDEDLAQIAKFVDERIAAAMSEMKSMLGGVKSAVDKMSKAVETNNIVAAYNMEPVLSVAERLHRFSVQKAGALAPDGHPLNQQKGQDKKVDPVLNPETSLQQQLGFISSGVNEHD